MRNKHFKTIIIFLAAVLIFTCLPTFAFANTDSQSKNVRVGWFAMDNFMEGGTEGTARSGFSYELLCEMAAYNHWNIEYVPGEFSDLYKLLEKGEIDVLPNVIATEERRENVLFHDFSLNEEHYYICTLRDNDLDVETDPAAISGKKLVVIKDAYEEKYFDAWAQENNVSMEKIYCDAYDAAWELVRQKKADYVLNINNTAPDSDFRTLYEVGIDNVYFAVAQNREDVLKDIDSALRMIDEISPFLVSNLRQKYLNKALSSYQLTADEKNWIDTHDTLRIGGLQNDVPYAYEDGTGTVTGAYVELTRLILKKLNIDSLQVEWSLYGSMDELRSALKNNELDLICPEYHSYSEAESNGFSISETIMNIPMGMLTLDSGGKGAVSTIATGGTRPGLIFVEENYPGVEIKALNSVDALVKAVEDHEADAAVAHIYALQESIENKKTNFNISPLSEPCIICYASLEENHELVMLMNRGFHLIEQSEKATMELQVASAEVSKQTLSDVIKDNLLVVVLVVLFIIAIVAYAVSRAVASQKLKEAADQLSSYKRAVLSDALISLEANLTKNQLYYGVWKDDNGKEISLKDILGLELPVSYDEYIKQWNLKFVKKGYGTEFSGRTDREYLLSTFENGTSDVSFDYEARTTAGKEVWLRRTINMTRNLDGDVVAYTNVKDISELVEQEKREDTYIRAIATEYDSIVVVGIEDGEYMDNMYLQRQLNNELTNSVDAEAGRESGFQEKLEIFYDFVYPEDREQFIEDTKKETIFRSFANNMTHVVRFRMSDVGGGYVYYQSRFIPLRVQIKLKPHSCLICHMTFEHQ